MIGLPAAFQLTQETVFFLTAPTSAERGWKYL